MKQTKTATKKKTNRTVVPINMLGDSGPICWRDVGASTPSGAVALPARAILSGAKSVTMRAIELKPDHPHAGAVGDEAQA